MNKKAYIPQPLTEQEEQEINALSKKIFQGSMFLVVSDEDRNSPDIKRYDELVQKKMAYMKYQTVAPLWN